MQKVTRKFRNRKKVVKQQSLQYYLRGKHIPTASSLKGKENWSWEIYISEHMKIFPDSFWHWGLSRPIFYSHIWVCVLGGKHAHLACFFIIVLGKSHGSSHSENSKDKLTIVNSRRNPNNTEKIKNFRTLPPKTNVIFKYFFSIMLELAFSDKIFLTSHSTKHSCVYSVKGIRKTNFFHLTRIWSVISQMYLSAQQE